MSRDNAYYQFYMNAPVGGGEDRIFLQSVTTFGILEVLRVYSLGKEGKMLTVWIIAANVIYIGGQRAGC